MSATETQTAAPTVNATEIGKTIYNQIGKRAFFMLGAKQVAYCIHQGRPGIYFKVRGSQSGNWIRVTLDIGSDLYVVELWKFRGTKTAPVAERTGIHVEDLHATIESLTGLRTSL